MSALLEVRGLSKRFATPRGTLAALDGVSFDLERGGSLALVGESGCGKSTLARCVVGLERPCAGSIRLDGIELAGLSPRAWRPHRRRIQMIFQDPGSSLDPRQKVGAIVAEPLAIHAIGSRAERRRRAIDLLLKVGLEPVHADRAPHELSGGQRQRVAIARALALGPEILVCDEPTSALDARTQAQVLSLLRALQESLGLALLFISHDLGVVRETCREVAVLYLGRIVERASAGELFERAAHPYARALISAAPLADPELEAARDPVVLCGDPPSPLSPPQGCAFHPRCPERARVPDDRCRREIPALRPLDSALAASETLVACHLSRRSVELLGR